MTIATSKGYQLPRVVLSRQLHPLFIPMLFQHLPRHPILRALQHEITWQRGRTVRPYRVIVAHQLPVLPQVSLPIRHQATVRAHARAGKVVGDELAGGEDLGICVAADWAWRGEAKVAGSDGVDPGFAEGSKVVEHAVGVAIVDIQKVFHLRVCAVLKSGGKGEGGLMWWEVAIVPLYLIF